MDLRRNFSDFGFEIITSDNENGSDFEINDTAKFVVLKTTSQSLYLKFKCPSKYTELKFNGKSVWIYVYSNSGKYPKTLEYDSKDNKLDVSFDEYNRDEETVTNSYLFENIPQQHSATIQHNKKESRYGLKEFNDKSGRLTSRSEGFETSEAKEEGYSSNAIVTNWYRSSKVSNSNDDRSHLIKSQVQELVRVSNLPLGDIKYSKVKETNPNKDESDIYVADRDSPLVPKSIIKVPERIQSALDVLAESAKLFKDKPHLGTRKKTVRPDGSFELGDFEFLTYEESYKVAKAIGTALTAKGLVPLTKINNCKLIKVARFVGIWSVNCPYWLLTDYACTGYGFVTVPIYEILGDEALLNIMKNTKMETVCIDSKKITNLENLYNETTQLKTVIVFDSLTDDDKNKLSKLGIAYYLMDDLVNEYKNNPQDPPKTKRTDICTIIYTSGTSGIPRGAIQTNEQLYLFSEKFGNVQNRANIKFESSMLSFLPLAHIYERTIEHVFCFLGGKIGYYSGDVKNILDDFQKFQPTFFLGVPRVYTKILSKVREQISNRNVVARTLINWCLKKKREKFEKDPLNHRNRFYDWFLGKISNKVGGKLEVMISGSAAMTSDDVCDIQAFLLSPMAEGWGTTEVGVPFVQDFRDPTKGTIGGPLYGVEFKLRSVPQLGYDARGNPPRGELMVKSPGMTLGYFAEDTLTKQNLEDGWFKSGDVAELLPNMGLKIIDRIQNIIKLSQGDYIASEKLENAYISSQFVDQVYVDIDSTKDHIVGIVVLSKENVEKWANKNSLKGSQMKDLLQNESLKKAIQDDFNKIADSQKFNSLEKLKLFTLVDDPFSVDNGMLTPTFKNVRHKIREKYKDIIQNMYSNSQPTQSKS